MSGLDLNQKEVYGLNTIYILSFAVLAFAVEDIKARDCVITSASPCAFLYELVKENITPRNE